MLFNDLILYASEGTTSKWKCHRVIHLSLCRLEDLRGIAYENAFRIVSPQKTFIVTAQNKLQKQQWLQSILHHAEQIHLIISMRRAQLAKSLAAGAAGGAGAGAGAAGAAAAPGAASSSSPLSPDGDIPLESRWTQPLSDGDLNSSGGAGGLNIGGAFGQASIKGDGSASSSSAAAAAAVRPNCKLCIRPWAIFRRKQKCRVCSDFVCNDCCSQKALVPGGEKKLVNVCDGRRTHAHSKRARSVLSKCRPVHPCLCLRLFALCFALCCFCVSLLRCVQGHDRRGCEAAHRVRHIMTAGRAIQP